MLDRAGWDITDTSLSSLNERLRQTANEKPRLEMLKASDIGQMIGIFEAYHIEVEIIFFDAKGYFSTVPVNARRSCEQGTLHTTGPSNSHVYDQGTCDAPMNTGEISSFLSEFASLAGDRLIKDHPAVIHCPKCARFRQERTQRFGKNNTNSRLVMAGMYSDDLALIAPKGTATALEELVHAQGAVVGVRWTTDKNGNRTHIGYDYITGAEGTRQHITAKKLITYTANCKIMVQKALTGKVASHHEGDSLLGQLGHTSTCELRLKTLSKRLSKCRHAHNRLSTPHSFLPTREIADDLQDSMAIMRRNVGIPVACCTRVPKHFELCTITARGDASLNEEFYSGWGGWWLVPALQGPPKIFAVYGQWSEYESEAMGSNIPVGEAICILLMERVRMRAKFNQPHHTGTLQLSDSITAANKFKALKQGSDCLDALRQEWLDLQPDDGSMPATLSHLPRENAPGWRPQPTRVRLSQHTWHSRFNTVTISSQ